MSWIISNALMKDYANSHCSQELVGDYLEVIYLDGAQSAESSGIPTQLVYLSQDKMTAFSRLSRFGMMCKPLTEDLGEDLLMWYLEDSHAKTLAVPGMEQESPESEAECGRTWRGSLAKYDPDTHSLKTAQCSLLEDSTQSSVTLPRWGTMRNGDVYQRPIAGQIISGTESGLWPTPRAGNPGSRPNGKGGKILSEEVEISVGIRQRAIPDGESFFHTPNTNGMDGGSNSRKALKKRMMATPTSTGDQLSPSMMKHPGCKMWATPTAHNAKEQNSPSESNRNTPTLAASVGGKLNPMWVEWLMGWPLGWTDLKPLGMDKFQEWQQQHSVFYPGE